MDFAQGARRANRDPERITESEVVRCLRPTRCGAQDYPELGVPGRAQNGPLGPTFSSVNEGQEWNCSEIWIQGWLSLDCSLYLLCFLLPSHPETFSSKISFPGAHQPALLSLCSCLSPWGQKQRWKQSRRWGWIQEIYCRERVKLSGKNKHQE